MALTEVPIELSSTPGIIDNSTGTAITIDSSNNTNFADNSKAIFGAGSDLQIYHDGSNSYIDDAGTGELLIRGSAVTRIQSYIGEDMIVGVTNGPANLYYDAAKKLATTATGIDVTGSVTADAIEIATTASDTGVELTLNGNKSSNGGVGSIIFENAGDSVGMIRSNRASANDAADMLFYTQATGGANTERMRIDSSGNVGIGSATANHFSTAGATNILGVKGTSGGLISIAATGTNFSGIDLGTDTTRRGGVYSLDGSHLAFYTNATNSGGSLTERLRIDASGNVGIGTDSPSSFSGDGADLVIGTTSGDNGLSIISGTSGTGNIYFGDVQETGTGSRKGQIVYDHATDHMRFATAATERMRIDSSGNLILSGNGGSTTNSVDISYNGSSGQGSFNADSNSGNTFLTFGTSSSGSLSEAMRINSSGNLLVNRTSVFTTAKMEIQSDAGDASTLALNSIDTDGSILEFYRAGATVGSIGSISSDLYIAESNSGLRFDGENNQILPSSTTASTDGTCNLGAGTARFKDLHLSQYVIAHQGAFLGGNASANYLDEYEEGTFTPILNSSGTAPTVTYTLQKGRYTKVGDLVTILVDCRWSANSGGTGNTTITGLPFSNGDSYAGATVFEHSSAWSYASGRTNLSAEVNQSAGIVTFLQNGSGLSGVGYDITTLGAAGYVIFSVTFKTA